MEENKMIEEINEGVVDTIYDGVSESNGGFPVAGTIAVLLGVVGVVGGIIYYRKKKNKCCELKTTELISESNEVVVSDNEDQE